MEPFASGQPTGICIHHSLTRDSETLSLKAIESYHVNTNAWDAIGYHVVTEVVGDEMKIMSGRSSAYQGAHERKLNATHLGLCIVGDYDKEEPRELVLETAARACVGLMINYPRIRLLDIVFHNDFSEKSCPGALFPKARFLALVDAFMKRYAIGDTP
jgi:N-acetyl-anhydromuramyl-L-alanine amidase AmpD